MRERLGPGWMVVLLAGLAGCAIESGSIEVDAGRDAGTNGQVDGGNVTAGEEPGRNDEDSPGCDDPCVPDDRRCEGNVVVHCGEHDGDPCLEWGGGEPCGEGRQCDPATATCLRTYPPGPYGTRYGDTIDNLCLEECLCPGGGVEARAFCLEEFLDARATLVSVHTGWCGLCNEQAASMESDLHQPYAAEGLRILLVLYEDAQGNGDRTSLLEACCEEKTAFGMSFTVAIDPGAQVTGGFFHPWGGSIPLNMLLDDEMVIRYKVEGTPYALEYTIGQLLSED